MQSKIKNYIDKLTQALNLGVSDEILGLAQSLLSAWDNGNAIYLFGNGGSAGNAIHLANDLIYGAGLTRGIGLRAESLSANSAVISCLANDLGYDKIYSEQIRVKGNPGDICIALSGSGNSVNIINAINEANKIGMKSFAILGFDGGKCKQIVQHPIHYEIHDMQVSEDLQLIVGHICMQWLCEQKNKNISINY